jgi:hypothetical protein
MGSFTNGLLVGIGISLLFAPRKGEETRRLLMERIRSMRSAQSEEPAPSTQGTVKPLQPVQETVPVVGPIEAAPPDTPAPATDIPSGQSGLSSSTPLSQGDLPPTVPGSLNNLSSPTPLPQEDPLPAVPEDQSNLSSPAPLSQGDLPPAVPGDTSPTQPLRKPKPQP